MEDHAGIVARRAVVVPRVRGVLDGEGEKLPLEHYVKQMQANEKVRLLNVFGGPGSGKTTALGHLAAVFGDEVVLVDGPLPEALNEECQLLVYATETRTGARAFKLAVWERDEWIEYLLKTHPEQCKSVMERLGGAQERVLGVPALCTIVLETLARDVGIKDAKTALRHYLAEALGPEGYRWAAEYCLNILAQTEDLPALKGLGERERELLRHRPVQVLLASEELARAVASAKRKRRFFAGVSADAASRLFDKKMDDELLKQTAEHLRESEEGREALRQMIATDVTRQPAAVSLMVCADEKWRPTARLKNLRGAQLARVPWAGVELSGCDLTGANLAGADLSGAHLVKARALEANFGGARLVGVELGYVKAEGADLSGADLSEVKLARAELQRAKMAKAKLHGAQLMGAELLTADLTGADLRRATLVSARMQWVNLDDAEMSHADLSEAIIVNVSFREAILRSTIFRNADLIRCDFEGMSVDRGLFAGADLTGSVLTNSMMPGADFEEACLRETGLAGVMWEGADLRGVDFAGASFHMGSTRSGLVGSVIASEGTRTGFYTDDYSDQDFKAPEEIRKANLCGCDLRGAYVDKTDFYLVDLRGAKYTEDQREHFTRCGAILRGR